jgi:quercetin dioxygenase-like cupin family protein
VDTGRFEDELRAEGYEEIAIRTYPSGVHNAAHEHAYDVRALVLDGHITLTAAGRARTYRAGEVFTMAAGCQHLEDVGTQGVRYIAGRRHPARS